MMGFSSEVVTLVGCWAVLQYDMGLAGSKANESCWNVNVVSTVRDIILKNGVVGRIFNILAENVIFWVRNILRDHL